MKLKTILFGGSEINSNAANSGLLFLRVFAGLGLAFAHGLRKFPPSDRFVQIVSDMGFPLEVIFAWAAPAVEFFGGLLLAAGLLTRPASFFIIITMFVAAFIRNAGNPFSDKELALLYLFVALAFLFIGSGRFGLDAVIRRMKKQS